MLTARVRARMALSETLRVTPVDWTERLRRRRLQGGAGGAVADKLARVMRHRPLAPLETFTLPDNPQIRLLAVESIHVRMLYWFGENGYEGAETYWWKQFCRDATSILELGANVGYYSVQGARSNPKARYRAVEPNPEAAEVVRRNLTLNGITNAEVLAVAVVGKKTSDTLELALPDQEQYPAPTGAFLRDSAEGVEHLTWTNTITVAVATMPELLEDADLLKLDIEGLEAEVLESVLPELLESKPVIFLEVLAKAGRLRPVIAKLSRGGYVIYAIGEKSLHLVSKEQIASPDPLPRYGSRDVILVPESRVWGL